MVLKDFLNKFKNRNGLVSDLENQNRAQNIVVGKSMSANEREVNRFREEARQEALKEELEMFRAKNRRELFNSNILNSKSIFNHKATVMGEDKSVLDNGNNMFMKPGNMF